MERETIGVVECTEDDPDGFMTALFGKHLVQGNESFATYSLGRHYCRGVSGYCLLDIFEIFGSEGLAETIDLEFVDLVIIQIAVLVFVTQIKYALQRGYTCWFEAGFLRVIEGRYGVCDSLLTKKENFIYVMMLPRARSNARINLLELGHHRKHLIFDHLFCIDIGAEIRLVCTQDHRHIDPQRSEMRHPEQSHSFIAVVV